MKKIGLVLDSSSNLNNDVAFKKGIGFVPLIINFNNQNSPAAV